MLQRLFFPYKSQVITLPFTLSSAAFIRVAISAGVAWRFVVLFIWCECGSLDYPSNITQLLYKGNPCRYRSALYNNPSNPHYPIRLPYQSTKTAPAGAFPIKMPRRSGAFITSNLPSYLSWFYQIQHSAITIYKAMAFSC